MMATGRDSRTTIASSTRVADITPRKPLSIAASRRAYSAVSLMTLRATSSGISEPSPLTGVAAPILVLGAIAATWEAMVTKTPAEAAFRKASSTGSMTSVREPEME